MITTHSIHPTERQPARPSRWRRIATGSAAAAVLLAGAATQSWQASADPGPDESTFVPITPVRILDTRDPVNVGLAGPFVSPGPLDLKVTGSVPTTGGTQTVVPDGATSVSLNVTVVDAGAAGFISVRPADAPGSPATSNLNFSAGQTVPNAVTVSLPSTGGDAGSIEITYDAYGQAGPTADVLIDVVGYSVTSGIQDLQSQLHSMEERLEAMEQEPGTPGDDYHAFSVYSGGQVTTPVSQGTNTIVQSVGLIAPADGNVVVNSRTTVEESINGQTITCAIARETNLPPAYQQEWYVDTFRGELSGTRGFTVTAGETFVANLVCTTSGPTGSEIVNPTMTAIYTPVAPPGSDLADAR